ncbi:MAG: L-threonylcarbamoyladenylate synthase [Bacillota bacterium]|nr:L-threonylcarbamoyladenylate synthase [Bacillota bacterium]
MKTKVIKIQDENFNSLDQAVDLLAQGQLVAFPTETVYGLGADGLNPQAVEKIFLAKGRPQDNPLILHVSDFKMLEDLTRGDLTRARILADRFWPGPMTLVLKKSDLVPGIISGGLDTVAIRLPSNKIAQELIRRLGRPIAAPSANISGRPSPTDASTTLEDLDGKIPLLVDGGPTKVGLESTVIDLSVDQPLILRPGGITLEMLREVFPEADIDLGLLSPDQAPKSPGQKYKHYAPKAEAYMIRGSLLGKVNKLTDFIRENPDKKIGLMASSQLSDIFSNSNLEVEDLGPWEDLDQVASMIFKGLRDLDRKNVDIIIVEAFSEDGLGLAIMNRLKKSTANRYIGE